MSGYQEPKKPVFYTRVSSLEQDVETSLVRQRQTITAAAQDRGLDIHKEYTEQEPHDDDTPTQEA